MRVCDLLNNRPFEIGRVTSPHGARGMVRVYPETDDMTRFALLDAVSVEGREYALERVAYHKNVVLLKLAGVDDMDAAERLRGAAVTIPAEKALPLAENEYWIRDLIGLRVVTEDGEPLGTVADVFPTGANDVYELDSGMMIPAAREFVREVDTDGGVITVRLIPGMREGGK
ncbi:MAG: ribosome maturation factor RimM [Clostridiales bacterium]|jgi:16S rRNA processing protein RimM|nr:ribosome maturation factor RimM [Clostridiales bacterium]